MHNGIRFQEPSLGQLVSTQAFLGSSWNAAFYGKTRGWTCKSSRTGRGTGDGKSNQSREIHMVIYSYRSNIPKTSHLMDGLERCMRGRNSCLKRSQFIRINYSIYTARQPDLLVATVFLFFSFSFFFLPTIAGGDSEVEGGWMSPTKPRTQVASAETFTAGAFAFLREN